MNCPVKDLYVAIKLHATFVRKLKVACFGLLSMSLKYDPGRKKNIIELGNRVKSVLLVRHLFSFTECRINLPIQTCIAFCMQEGALNFCTQPVWESAHNFPRQVLYLITKMVVPYFRICRSVHERIHLVRTQYLSAVTFSKFQHPSNLFKQLMKV